MRDPTVDARAAAETKRVRDYAIGKAKCELWFMINRLHLEEKNPAEAAYYSALNLTLRTLKDPDADKLVRKYASAPDARDKIILALQTGRPPLRPKQGRRTDTLRNRWIADIIEGIRLLGFDVSRGALEPLIRARGANEMTRTTEQALRQQQQDAERDQRQPPTAKVPAPTTSTAVTPADDDRAARNRYLEDIAGGMPGRLFKFSTKVNKFVTVDDGRGRKPNFSISISVITASRRPPS
jgi:hypothetical protein